MPQRLERSQHDRMIAGVCGGIAAYLQVDPTIVRVFFVALTVFGGIGLLAYILLVIVMPLPGARLGSTVVAEAGAAGEPAASPAAASMDPARRRELVGIALIALGVLFLANTAGFFRFLDWRFIWPLALIALGAVLLMQRARR